MDVLKILVSANYKDVPSLDDILEMAAVTRLRNQLLEAEHYQLAVEVRGQAQLHPEVSRCYPHVADVAQEEELDSHSFTQLSLSVTMLLLLQLLHM